MKKFELIREIFDAVMRSGTSDEKLDSISGYTKDKFNNPVYVRKIKINLVEGVDSVAVTSISSDFSDTCDSDLRIAYNDKNIGQRVFIWANEADTPMLEKIYSEVNNKQSFCYDLSARVLYGVKAKVGGLTNPYEVVGIHNEFVIISTEIGDDYYSFSKVKPYLRRINDMTLEEEKMFKELNDLTHHRPDELVSFLNSIHIDYRGMIDLGFALEAPEGMYPKNC